MNHRPELDDCKLQMAKIGHDLTNYLLAIGEFAKKVKLHLPPLSIPANAIDRILEAQEQSIRLAEDLRAYPGKNTQTHSQPISAMQSIRDTLACLDIHRPGTVRVTIDGDPNCLVLTSSTAQFHRLVANICINAFQALEKTGSHLQVSVAKIDIQDKGPLILKGLEPGCHTWVKFIDDGCGISPEDLPHIFKSDWTNKKEGTGLGLAIVNEVVQANSGLILVDSKPGKGTQFDLYFPCSHSPQRNLWTFGLSRYKSPRQENHAKQH